MDDGLAETLVRIAGHFLSRPVHGVDRPEEFSAVRQSLKSREVERNLRPLHGLAIGAEIRTDRASDELRQVRGRNTPACDLPVEDEERETGLVGSDAHVLHDET